MAEEKEEEEETEGYLNSALDLCKNRRNPLGRLWRRRRGGPPGEGEGEVVLPDVKHVQRALEALLVDQILGPTYTESAAEDGP